MLKYSIIDAPSILGLRPTGVEGLPEALKKAGLMDKLNAIYVGRVQPLFPYNPKRDPSTHIMNAEAIKMFSIQLAQVVKTEIITKT